MQEELLRLIIKYRILRLLLKDGLSIFIFFLQDKLYLCGIMSNLEDIGGIVLGRNRANNKMKKVRRSISIPAWIDVFFRESELNLSLIVTRFLEKYIKTVSKNDE